MPLLHRPQRPIEYGGAFTPPKNKWRYERTTLERAGCICLSLQFAHKTLWPLWPCGCCLVTALIDVLAMRMSLELDARIVLGVVSEEFRHAWIEPPDGGLVDPTYVFDGGPALRVLPADQVDRLGHVAKLKLSLDQEESFRRGIRAVSAETGWSEESGVIEIFESLTAPKGMTDALA